MSTIYTPVGGWLHQDGEDAVNVAKNAVVLSRSPLEQRILAESPPEEVRPDEWMEVINQGGMGSCRGCDDAATTSMDFYRQTGAELRFSAAYSYRTGQIKNNIHQDEGSTIEGGLKALQDGICRETFMPYTDNYDQIKRIPQAAHEDARNAKLSTWSLAPNVDAIFDHVLLGRAISFGIMWGGMIDQQAKNGGLILEWRRERQSGGHAIPGLAIKKHDGQKRGLLGIKNSWSKRWGDNGWGWFSYDAISRMLDDSWNVVALVGGMEFSDEVKNAYLPRYDF